MVGELLLESRCFGSQARNHGKFETSLGYMGKTLDSVLEPQIFCCSKFLCCLVFWRGIRWGCAEKSFKYLYESSIVVEGFNINLYDTRRSLLFPFDSLRGNYCLACVKSIL